MLKPAQGQGKLGKVWTSHQNSAERVLKINLNSQLSHESSSCSTNAGVFKIEDIEDGHKIIFVFFIEKVSFLI